MTRTEPSKLISVVNISGVASSYEETGKAITPKPKVDLIGIVLKEGIDYTLSYSNNVKPGKATIIITGVGNYEGTKTVNFTITPKKSSMYRLYNPNSGEHFYTADPVEKDYLVSVGWEYEGEGWKAPNKSYTPVYRLYNKNDGDHHYTMNETERKYLISIGWNDEGIGWYSDEARSVPVYRQYNPNAKSGSHNYTTNKNENDYLVAHGWRDEGICWYGI